MSLEGIGKKDPYKAFSRSPSSLQMGLWTVTRYVPVGKVPSTINSESDATTEGCTWRRPSMVVPIDMRSATVWFPSRMSCLRSAGGATSRLRWEAYFLQIIRNQGLVRSINVSSRHVRESYGSLSAIQLDTACQSTLC